MFRCMACNSIMDFRITKIELEDGEVLEFEEELCKKCYDSAFSEHEYEYKKEPLFYRDGLTPALKMNS